MNIMQSVIEAYAGKSKELLACEGYLREIIDLIDEDYYEGKLTSKRHVTRDAEPCKKLEATLEKFFGVEEICIYWDTGNINAYSVPGTSILIASRNAKGDFSKAKFHICIYENLVYHAELNEKELMAVLLHEIGHCFYSSPFLVGGELLGYIMSPMSLVVAFIGMNIIKLGDRLDEFTKKKIPGFYNIFNKFQDFIIQINSIMRYTTILPNPLIVIKNAANNLSNPITMVGKYGGERGADSFAAKYGYGGDQISALKKLTKPANTAGVKMVTSLGGLGDFVSDYNEIICDLFTMMSLDPHPNNDVRAQSMIRKLERDLRSGDYPPELKKDLEQEIGRLKRIYSTIDDNKSNVEIKKAWYNMLNALTHGHSDIREILDTFYAKYEF